MSIVGTKAGEEKHGHKHEHGHAHKHDHHHKKKAEEDTGKKEPATATKKHHKHHHHHKKQGSAIDPSKEAPITAPLSSSAVATSLPLAESVADTTLEKKPQEKVSSVAPIPIPLSDSSDKIIVIEGSGRERLTQSSDTPRPPIVSMRFSSDDKANTPSLWDLAQTYLPGARWAASALPGFVTRHQNAGHRLANTLSHLGEAESKSKIKSTLT